MLLRLESVLDQAQVAEIRRIIEAAKWIDGVITGDPALKHNLEADRRSHPEYGSAIQKVLGALMAQPRFRSYVSPKEIIM